MEDARDFIKLSREILKEGGSIRFQAHGRSMHPFIRDEDFLIVKPTKISDIRVGDVVLFQVSMSRLSVHRVVKINSSSDEIMLMVRGDLSTVPDQAVSSETYLGRVISIERDGKVISLDSSSIKLLSFLIAKMPFLPVIWKRFDKFLHPQERMKGGQYIPYVAKTKFFIKGTEGLLSGVREKFDSAEEVIFHSERASDGLDEWEEEIVNKYMLQKGSLLNIGCGAGREAIALAKRGFKIVGIDIAPQMIKEAIRNAQAEGLDVTFEEKDITKTCYPAQSFNYILFSQGVYSNIPTRKLRIETLKKIRRPLKPDGLLFFTVEYKERRIFTLLTIVDFIRKLAKPFLRNLLKSEPGDVLIGSASPASNLEKVYFCHLFKDSREVKKEIFEAGFNVIEEGDKWVLKA